MIFVLCRFTKMPYTTDERIAMLEEIVAIQTEQIDRLQRTLYQLVQTWVNIPEDDKEDIFNFMCGENNEFIKQDDYHINRHLTLTPKDLFDSSEEDDDLTK